VHTHTHTIYDRQMHDVISSLYTILTFCRSNRNGDIIVSFLSTWTWFRRNYTKSTSNGSGSDLEKCSEDLDAKCLSRRRRHRRDMPVRSHLANRRRHAETSGDHSANFGPVRSIWQNTDHDVASYYKIKIAVKPPQQYWQREKKTTTRIQRRDCSFIVQYGLSY